MLLPEKIPRYGKRTSSIQYVKKCASHPAVLRSLRVPVPYLSPGQALPFWSGVLPHWEAHKGLPKVLYPGVSGLLCWHRPGLQGWCAVIWCGLFSVLLPEVLLLFRVFWQGRILLEDILRILPFRLEHRLQLPVPSWPG